MTVYDQVAPDGTRVVVDRQIGICSVHGWWFGLGGRSVIACPEPGCQAEVLVYEHAGRVAYLSRQPDASAFGQKADGDA